MKKFMQNIGYIIAYVGAIILICQSVRLCNATIGFMERYYFKKEATNNTKKKVTETESIQKRLLGLDNSTTLDFYYNEEFITVYSSNRAEITIKVEIESDNKEKVSLTKVFVLEKNETKILTKNDFDKDAFFEENDNVKILSATVRRVIVDHWLINRVTEVTAEKERVILNYTF